MKNIKKVEYVIFILLLLLQNFAIITTKSFGINGLVCFLFVITLLRCNKYYFRIKKKSFIIIVSLFIFLFISSIVNDDFYYLQILRYVMIVWLVYVSNIYINNIFEKNHGEYFLKLYINILLYFLLYGIYEFFANIYSLPLYMNVFGNNPSYEVKSLYRYFGGWIDKYRLYNSFYEPSVFSIFLVYNFFFLKEQKIEKNKKTILYFLIIFNLYFTYARTGYVVMIYMCMINILYNTMQKNKKRSSIIDIIILLIPFINVIIMYYIGLNLFDDLSSLARTYSPIYYLKESFSSIKYIVFGHSTGSIVKSDVKIKHIEAQAHNGYIDIVHQFGWIVFCMFFKFLYDKAKLINNKKYLIIGIFSTFCCFASYFCVETIIVLIVLIYNFALHYDIKE